METHVTEEQQLAELKKWWKENASSIITGIIIGLAALFGTKTWFTWQKQHAEQAAEVYTVMMSGLEQGQQELFREQAATLAADFDDTPYATLAALALARSHIEANELEDAEAQLRWAEQHAPSAELRNTARLRLARVLAARGQYDAADGELALLDSEASFAALLAEIRGDVAVMRGDRAAAAAAYHRALALTGAGKPTRNLLQLKYDDVADAAQDGDTQSP